jgi:Phosphate-selective porin O and P
MLADAHQPAAWHRRVFGGLFALWLALGTARVAQAQPDDAPGAETDEPDDTAVTSDEANDGNEAAPSQPEAPEAEDRAVDGMADSAPTEPAPAPVNEAAAGDDEPLDIREAAQLSLGPVKLAPFVLVRAHANPYVGDDAFFQVGDIAEQEGFRLRHGRLGIHTSYEDQARIRVSMELGGDDDGGARVHDAFVGYTPFDFAQLLVGAQNVPFSRYELIRSGRGALIQSPVANRAMAPGHQVGMVARGFAWEGALGYQLGLFNGLQRGNLFYQGYDENYAPFGNRFDGLMYMVRLSSDPLGRMPMTAADEVQGDFLLGVGANYMFSDGGARDVHTGGGDLHAKFRGAHLIVEGLWSRTVPESVPSADGALPFEITAYSIVLEGGYMVLPRMLGLATRFEWIDPNLQTEDETDNWLVTAGAHFHLIDQLLKAQLEFTHREERFGLSLDNDAFTLSLQGQIDPARPGGKER